MDTRRSDPLVLYQNALRVCRSIQLFSHEEHFLLQNRSQLLLGRRIKRRSSDEALFKIIAECWSRDAGSGVEWPISETQQTINRT